MNTVKSINNDDLLDELIELIKIGRSGHITSEERKRLREVSAEVAKRKLLKFGNKWNITF